MIDPNRTIVGVDEQKRCYRCGRFVPILGIIPIEIKIGGCSYRFGFCKKCYYEKGIVDNIDKFLHYLNGEETEQTDATQE